jgi:hypothetical protein
MTKLIDTAVEKKIQIQDKELQHLKGDLISMREQLNNVMRAFRSTTNIGHQPDLELFTSREKDQFGKYLNDYAHKQVYDEFFAYSVKRDGVTHTEYAFESVPQENGGDGKKASRNEPTVLL